MKISALLPIICTLSLSACVTIEAPDNLISDTIKAGKDVYKDLTGDEDENKQHQGQKRRHSVKG